MSPRADSASASGSSDFVRKLYRMLEDRTWSDIVRWGSNGDTFVVLENEKFTKSVLPRHFKHSNFASFVRQLNKYDFHKVRHTEETGSLYGPGPVWEFKHPEFKANMQGSLDNIRRKAPAPRKHAPEELSAAQTANIAAVNETLSAASLQISVLEDFSKRSIRTISEELASLSRLVKSQCQMQREMVTYLENLDERRRNSKHANPSASGQFGPGGLGMLPESGDDVPPAELRRAREIMNVITNTVDSPAYGRELERMLVAIQNIASPPDSSTPSSSAMFPNSGGMGWGMNDPMQLVYPQGHNQGIDPFGVEMNSVPYAQQPMPTNQAVQSPSLQAPPMPGPSMSAPPMASPGMATQGVLPPPPSITQPEHPWHGNKPCILLVEDDRVCQRIGTKFLSFACCDFEVAHDGKEAVDKFTANPRKYSLIFMDIIMPTMDGVTATNEIRILDQEVPIVAMTSNIRQDDVMTYIQIGMTDILAKPFTRDGMIRMVRRHLGHQLKYSQGEGLMAESDAQPTYDLVWSGSATVPGGPMTSGPPMTGGPMAGAQIPATPMSGQMPGAPMLGGPMAVDNGSETSGPGSVSGPGGGWIA